MEAASLPWLEGRCWDGLGERGGICRKEKTRWRRNGCRGNGMGGGGGIRKGRDKIGNVMEEEESF